MDFENTLTRKVGPIPVWGWGVLFGAVFILWLRRKGVDKAQATQVTVDPNNPDGITYGDPTQLPFPTGPMDSYLANDPTNSAYPVGLTASGIPAPVTNVQWGRLTSDYLTGLGDVPSLVQTALAKYLGGATLTQQEQAIVNQALTHFGAPPEGVQAVIPQVPPVTTPPTPTPTPTPAPIGRADQFRRVLTVGQSGLLTDYVRMLLGKTASPTAVNLESVAVVNDPRNAALKNQLGGNRIYGGNAIWFPQIPVNQP